MKAVFYWLIGMAALALSACNGEKKITQEADSEKVARYTKHISRKWRIDSLFMKRELQTYWDSVYQVSHRIMPGFEKYSADVLQGNHDGFLTTILYRQEEFFPDGRRIAKSSLGYQTAQRKYAFSKDLDSLHFLDVDGEAEGIYKLASISDTAFVIIQDLYLPTKKLENRTFFKARCKFVPNKG